MLTYNIAITIDDNYLQHACVMLKSLAANTPLKITVYCIFDNLSNKNHSVLSKAFAGSTINIVLIKFDDSVLPQLPIKPNDHVSAAAFFRIWLPQILSHIKQVVFLDTDMVINGDISGLFNLNITDYPLAAVEDLGMNDSKKATLGMSAGKKYFNSGVMVMNLEYFRQHKLTDKLAHFISSSSHLCEFWDQDAFNAIVNGYFYSLPFQYNVQSVFYSLQSDTRLTDAIHSPLIVHYTGGGNYKPWYYHNRHPLKMLYYKYLKQTQFWLYYPPDLPRSWFIFRKLKFMFFK